MIEKLATPILKIDFKKMVQYNKKKEWYNGTF